MKQKSCLNPLLLSFYCLSNLQWTWAAPFTEETPRLVVLSPAFETQLWEFPNPCYVEKSRVDTLLIQISNTLQISNTRDEYLQRNNNFPADQVPSGVLELCTDERIAKIENDLTEVAGKLSQLTDQHLEPPIENSEINWSSKTWELIQDLKALNVFYDNSIVRYPFLPLVEHLDHILIEAFFPPLTTTVPEILFDHPKPYQQCDGEPTRLEMDRLSGLMKQQTALLLNALESEMTLYAKSVPGLKLVPTKAFDEIPRDSGINEPFSPTNSPQQCNINTTVFNDWNNEFSGNIRKIRLPSEAATCVAILKIAHSAVSEIKARAETLTSWRKDDEKYLNLKGLASNVESLLQEFSKGQTTEPYSTHWQLILTTGIDLNKAVKDLGPSSSGPQPCILPPGPPEPPYQRVDGYVESVDDQDATWYSSKELEKE